MPCKTPPARDFDPKRPKRADPLGSTLFPYARPRFRTVCKIFARKIGTNKINGLGAAEIRCKDDRSSSF